MRILAALVLLFPFTAAARQAERSLFWRALEVTARLDADGRLHVVERQAMVFSGDWNGGERRFRVAPGQRLDVEGMERVDPATGRTVPLSRGDLSAVDHYGFTGETTLRWRSRLPSDPPFERAEIVYVLRYTLSDILVPVGDGYRLDHDFAFTDREGVIERFTLDLDLDPVWSVTPPFARSITRLSLPPGAGVVVTKDLRYRGGSRPAGVFHGAPAWFGWLLALSLLGGIAYLAVTFERRERSVGRFAPLVPPESIDSTWLEQNLFRVAPEVAGAAWDSKIGASEVSAILARLVTEGKIKSAVLPGKGGKPTLHLELLVERDRLGTYEQTLVKGLFFSGSRTDTEGIRTHYKGSGFDPAALIQPSLQYEVTGVVGGFSTVKAPWRRSVAAFITAIALMVIACVIRPSHVGLGLFAAISGLITWVIAITQAYAWRDRVWRPGPHSLRFLVPLAAYTALVLWVLVMPWGRIHALALAAFACLCFALWSSVLNGARSRHSEKGVAYRKQLAAAREYFRVELAKPSPRLEDRWFPYLLAFGLDSNVDRWFRAFGGRARASGQTSVETSHVSSSSAASSPGSWTGGGGMFGGGGASATWAAAAGSLAAGVAAPSSSSSSSSSGGSSSSSSSGGGGGGGW
jgi:uncharacterized membrane protein YgcG